ncbi:MAG: potassium/hydrogen antiporter [Thermoplasmata archaeon]|nr:potassium/hydrogen antiporter [Thermoplasmata archaeon]MEA3165661.1 potassium/hydrogen antiporter [Thermoplasmata archaeon]
MASVAVTALLAIGASVAVAFVGSMLFRKTHIPDILFLLGCGALLGPVLHLVDVDAVQSALPVLGALAIITILFDGALEVTPGQMRLFGVPAVGLSLTVLATTTVLCAILAHGIAGMDWTPALLLGLCFGGAGIAIIVPLARRMGISHDANAVVLLEAVTSDIFVIIAMFIACTVVAVGSLGAALAVKLLLIVAIAIATGPLAGWLWARFLGRWGHTTNAYMATLAVLVLVYALTEVLGGSGALAVLLFGIVVGNSKGRPIGSGLRNQVFARELVAFHHEVVFFVRAAFFTGLGAVTRWELLQDPAFLVTGLLLALAVGVCRSLGVGVALGRSGLSRWDRVATAMLFPMGLVTAAVSVVPKAFGIPGAQLIVDYAAVVIVLTNVLGTVAVFAVSAIHDRFGRPTPAAVPRQEA